MRIKFRALNPFMVRRPPDDLLFPLDQEESGEPNHTATEMTAAPAWLTPIQSNSHDSGLVAWKDAIALFITEENFVKSDSIFSSQDCANQEADSLTEFRDESYLGKFPFFQFPSSLDCDCVFPGLEVGSLPLPSSLPCKLEDEEGHPRSPEVESPMCQPRSWFEDSEETATPVTVLPEYPMGIDLDISCDVHIVLETFPVCIAAEIVRQPLPLTAPAPVCWEEECTNFCASQVMASEYIPPPCDDIDDSSSQNPPWSTEAAAHAMTDPVEVDYLVNPQLLQSLAISDFVPHPVAYNGTLPSFTGAGLTPAEVLTLEASAVAEAEHQLYGNVRRLVRPTLDGLCAMLPGWTAAMMPLEIPRCAPSPQIWSVPPFDESMALIEHTDCLRPPVREVLMSPQQALEIEPFPPPFSEEGPRGSVPRQSSLLSVSEDVAPTTSSCGVTFYEGTTTKHVPLGTPLDVAYYADDAAMEDGGKKDMHNALHRKTLYQQWACQSDEEGKGYVGLLHKFEALYEELPSLEEFRLMMNSPGKREHEDGPTDDERGHVKVPKIDEGYIGRLSLRLQQAFLRVSSLLLVYPPRFKIYHALYSFLRDCPDGKANILFLGKSAEDVTLGAEAWSALSSVKNGEIHIQVDDITSFNTACRVAFVHHGCLLPAKEISGEAFTAWCDGVRWVILGPYLGTQRPIVDPSVLPLLHPSHKILMVSPCPGTTLAAVRESSAVVVCVDPKEEEFLLTPSTLQWQSHIDVAPSQGALGILTQVSTSIRRLLQTVRDGLRGTDDPDLASVLHGLSNSKDPGSRTQTTLSIPLTETLRAVRLTATVSRTKPGTPHGMKATLLHGPIVSLHILRLLEEAVRDVGPLAAAATVESLIRSGWEPSAEVQGVISQIKDNQGTNLTPKDEALQEIIKGTAGGADSVLVCLRKSQYVAPLASTWAAQGITVVALADAAMHFQDSKLRRVVVIYDGDSPVHRYTLTPAYHPLQALLQCDAKVDVVELHTMQGDHHGGCTTALGLEGFCEALVARHNSFREGAVIPQSAPEEGSLLQGSLSPYQATHPRVAQPLFVSPMALEDFGGLVQMLCANPASPSYVPLQLTPTGAHDALHPAHIVVASNRAVLVLDLEARVTSHGENAREHLVAELALLSCQFRRITVIVLYYGSDHPSLSVACFLGSLAVSTMQHAQTTFVFCNNIAHAAAHIRRLACPGAVCSNASATSPAAAFLSCFPAFHSVSAAEVLRCVCSGRPDATVAEFLVGLTSKEVSVSGLSSLDLTTPAVRTLAMLAGPKSAIFHHASLKK